MMKNYRPALATILALWSSRSASAFAPLASSMPSRTVQSDSVWPLRPVIYGDSEDVDYSDPGIGGVRLAMESAIKIKGPIHYKPGSAEADPIDLLRYTQLTKLNSDADVKAVLGKVNGKVIAKGFGVENYVDPGETTQKIVFLGPVEAAKNAVATAASAQDANSVVLNFLGGDDLMLMEVCDAASHLILHMDVPTKSKISFNSLCHHSIPEGTCSVCVVAVNDAPEKKDDSVFKGAERSIANGELYFYRDTWWTVQESDINTAVA